MKKRVLVVDDNTSIRESLQRVLLTAGYEVSLAADGEEAVDRFDSAQVDLIVLDLHLPNRGGWDVFERITSQYPIVPVVIITGLPNQLATAQAAGGGALMEKPIEVPALLRTMEELLAESKETRLLRLCGQRNDTRYVPPGCKLFLEKV
jgi:CheY-like chemotaxis protein